MSDAPSSEENRPTPVEEMSRADSAEGPQRTEERTPKSTSPPAENGPPTSRPTVDPPQASDAEPPETSLWLRPRDRLFLAVMLAAAMLLTFAHWVRLSGWGMREVEIDRHPARQFEYRIDVNTATWVEWAQLEGIGETLAMRIVEDRRQNGPFDTIDDLQRVKGIGPKKLEAIRKWLNVVDPPALKPKPAFNPTSANRSP